MNITTKYEKDQYVYLIGLIEKQKINGILIAVNGYGTKVSYNFTENRPPVPEEEIFGTKEDVLNYWNEKLK